MSYLNSAISIFIFFLFGTTSEVVAQDRFNGFVQDAETSEGLPFATVQTTPNGLITSADVNGYFTLELMVELTDSLKFSYVGYQTQVFALSAFTNSKTAVVKLASASVLPTIEVTLPKTAYGISSSVMTPSVAELARIPALGGEVDLLKGLALLPGISTGSEGSAAINIRGGSPNQTDLLIDGNRVYNVNHIGGFLSALPPFGVKALTVFKGGVPSRYGGRLSGVVDITLKEGRRDQLVKSFTLGLGTLQAAAEGPVGQNASFLVAGRYSYPTLIYNFANLNSYKRYESGYFQTVGLYDFVGKYGYNFNKHKITFSTFLSGDRGIDQNAFNGNVVADDFRWANHSYTLTHQYRTAQGGVWTNALQYLNYHYAYDSRQIPRRQAEQVITSSRSTLSNQVHDFVIRSEFTQPIEQFLDVSGGVVVTSHAFIARITDISTRGEEVTRQVDREISQATGEVAAFANADVRLLEDRFKLMAGFRFSGIGNVLPQNVEPRIRLSYSLLKNLYINGSLDRHYQYVHQVTPDVTIYPNELYLLPGDRFPAEKSDQAAVGVGGLLNTLQWSVEVFQKRQSGLVQINPGQERSENFIERFPNNVLSGGEGKMKGLEIYLKRDAEKLSYSLAYTLSKSERRYDEINGGQWFPFTYDRRHDLSTTLSKAIGEKWRMNASFTFQSGYSFSAPIARTAFFDIYGKYNGARLTPFHLLNLSATKLWNGSKRPNRYHSITYALYNAYNRPNAYSLELTPTSRTIVDPITGVEQTVSSLKIVTLSLFPIVPSLNYTVTIK